MKWYCKKCATIHDDNELCPKIKLQLKNNKNLLGEAANFITVAGEYDLITSNNMNKILKPINNLLNSDLTYESTYQFTRDIQVFKRLNEEFFNNCNAFLTPKNAQKYLIEIIKKAIEKAKNTGKSEEETVKKAINNFMIKITGASQEVDWLRYEKGKLSSIFNESVLYNGNAAGVDGQIVNRITGNAKRVTIKASIDTMTKDSTGVNDINEALKKGTLEENELVVGPKGMTKALREAGVNNPVEEINSAKDIRDSNERLLNKIKNGEATPSITGKQLLKKVGQGAIIGGAISLSISSITNYIRYRNGEIDREEAFKEISKDTVKGLLTGGAISGVSLFFPPATIGAIVGVTVGIYINKTVSNILDEIYGKGGYKAILDSSGYVYGMTINLLDYYKEISKNIKETKKNINETKEISQRIKNNFDVFEKLKGE